MPEPEYAKSQREISRITGIDRGTLKTYFAMPGAPKRSKMGFNLADVRAFIASNGQNGRLIQKADDSYRSKKTLKLDIEVEEARFDLERKKGKYILLTEHQRQVRTGLGLLKQMLSGLPGELAAPFGSIGPEIDKLASEIIEKTLAKMAKEFGEMADAGAANPKP